MQNVFPATWRPRPPYSPEPVALPEEGELQSDDAAEGGSDDASLQGRLAQPAGEQVDVLNALVHLRGERGGLGHGFNVFLMHIFKQKL